MVPIVVIVPAQNLAGFVGQAKIQTFVRACLLQIRSNSKQFLKVSQNLSFNLVVPALNFSRKQVADILPLLGISLFSRNELS